jgi:hypothetical protein
VKARVQPVEHANAPNRRLHEERQARLHRRFDPLLNLQVLLAARVALQPGHGHRLAAGPRQRFHAVELGVELIGAVQQVEVAHDLHHAVAQALKGLGQARQLVVARIRGRGVLALGGAVVVAAPGAEPGGASLQGFAQEAYAWPRCLARVAFSWARARSFITYMRKGSCGTCTK